MELSDEMMVYINKKVVYTSLLLQEYGYRELLDNPLIKGESRHTCRKKLMYVKNQLLQIEKNSGATKSQIEIGEGMALENVGLMGSLIGTLAVVPGTQIDFIETQFTELCLKAIDRHNSGENDKV